MNLEAGRTYQNIHTQKPVYIAGVERVGNFTVYVLSDGQRWQHGQFIQHHVEMKVAP